MTSDIGKILTEKAKRWKKENDNSDWLESLKWGKNDDFDFEELEKELEKEKGVSVVVQAPPKTVVQAPSLNIGLEPKEIMKNAPHKAEKQTCNQASDDFSREHEPSKAIYKKDNKNIVVSDKKSEILNLLESKKLRYKKYDMLDPKFGEFVSFNNFYYDCILSANFSKTELKVVLWILRNTMGYNRQTTEIKNIKDVAKHTCISSKYVYSSLESLKAKNVIFEKSVDEMRGGVLKRIKKVGLTVPDVWIEVGETVKILVNLEIDKLRQTKK